MKKVAELEAERIDLQRGLDTQKDSAARNRMGQFATPTALAVAMLRYAKARLGKEDERTRFLDPAVGTGAFYSALLNVFPRSRVDAAVGYEIDSRYGEPAARLWSGMGLEVRLEDFTKAEAPDVIGRFNLLICNPPYVRHHHIPSFEKHRLRTRAREARGARVGGLAGLYCYFLALSHAWMADGGLAGWLIPSEFMDVNYGVPLKRYLLDRVTLLHIHRFDPKDAQFDDALVSSAMVWFRKECPRAGYETRFSYGGTLERPKVDRRIPTEWLRQESKWTRYPMGERREAVGGPVLGDFFQIKRGLVTGGNGYFILSDREIERRELPMAAFRPILPSPRHVPVDEVMGDRDGNPVLERRLFLLDPPWAEGEIRERYPNLWIYLREGKANGVADGYLCRRRARWYAQEDRPPAPIVCTYLGRGDKKSGRPFRFILNHSRATAANVYLMLYPKEPIRRALRGRPELTRQIWDFLNRIHPRALLDEGRVYGGGLRKLEPRELGNVSAKAIAGLLPEAARSRGERQAGLFPSMPRA